jgi:hypothetical protein
LCAFSILLVCFCGAIWLPCFAHLPTAWVK